MRKDVELVTVGRKGYNYFRNRDVGIDTNYGEVFRQLEFAKAAEIAQGLTGRFVGGEIDRVLLVFSEFRLSRSRFPLFSNLLPILPKQEEDGAERYRLHLRTFSAGTAGYVGASTR